jgi:Ferredoxin-like domain in Api92-like protein
MPNWCENTLTVEGAEKDVQRFKQLAKPKATQADVDLSLASLYPIPEGVYQGDLGPEETQRYGKNNWRDWCITHWGTKWDADARLTNELPDFLVYEFESAWSPPVAWLTKVARDFPRLRFTLIYDEPGMGFAGTSIADQGKLIVDDRKENA